jgi:SET domain-containing protein
MKSFKQNIILFIILIFIAVYLCVILYNKLGSTRAGQECIEYLNSTVWATLRPSPIHGIGVFAIRDIPKGTQITDHADYGEKHALNQLTPQEMNQLHPTIRKIILDRTHFTEEDTLLQFYSPNHTASLQSWMNHSDTPNTTGTHVIRNIKAGEELTENYNTLAPGNPHYMTKEHQRGYA